MRLLYLFFLYTSYCFAVEIPGGSILSFTKEGDTKVFHLVVSSVTKEIYNENKSQLTSISKKFEGSLSHLEPYQSQRVKGWGYNDNIPGPAIVVEEGEHIKIVVENKLSVPTSLQIPFLQIPYSDESLIAPGKSHTYEFTITGSAGTYYYASGYQTAIQLGMGMSGLFIILPKGGEDIARDFGFVLQEWDVTENGDIRPLSINCSWFTMNGFAAPNIPILKVTEGDRVRLRFANTSGVSDSPMVLHGFAFRITGTEGGPAEPTYPQNHVAVVVVHPGTTRTVEFNASQPGLWRLSCSIPQKTVNNLGQYTNEPNITSVSVGGLFTFVEVAPKSTTPSP